MHSRLVPPRVGCWSHNPCRPLRATEYAHLRGILVVVRGIAVGLSARDRFRDGRSGGPRRWVDLPLLTPKLNSTSTVCAFDFHLGLQNLTSSAQSPAPFTCQFHCFS